MASGSRVTPCRVSSFDGGVHDGPPVKVLTSTKDTEPARTAMATPSAIHPRLVSESLTLRRGPANGRYQLTGTRSGPTHSPKCPGGSAPMSWLKWAPYHSTTS